MIYDGRSRELYRHFMVLIERQNRFVRILREIERTTK